MALLPDSSKSPRVALFVDGAGYAQVAPHLPADWICAIVGAAIRPAYVPELRAAAAYLGVPFLLQPRYDDVGFAEFVENFEHTRPNRILSNSYSMILRPEILRIVDYAALNVHAALLPRHRGPNPMQWALIKDDALSGVTIHYLNDEMDAGAIVAQACVRIVEEDTWISLRDKIMVQTDELFRVGLMNILSEMPAGVRQENVDSTKNARLSADTPELIPATMSDREMFNWIRAQVAPLKGAFVRRGSRQRHVDRYVAFGDIPALRKELVEWLEKE